MNPTNIRIQIDGKASEIDIGKKIPFRDVMQTVHDMIEIPDVSITRVCLNGEDITGKDWEGFAQLTSDSINDLQVETGNVKNLARNTLVSLCEFIDKLVDELKRTTELLRLGSVQQSGESLARALDGIQLANHTTALVGRNLQIETEFSPGNGNSIEKNLNNLQPIIEDMFSAQNSQDWVLLADLIEYELLPHFDDRLRILRTWKDDKSV